ncbi:arylamine N-acetyltransferase 2 [Aspergillus heteromorphus CBS 117.55]|uniref:Arylamine N-acetyltransferase 2 n=1 Tax=Aspergillus heteromorphus CBS 117.55 TaxID=1448321 RepID=A0A317V0N2_9EURO|nr:arylamine N-acetyltransferase 2 [Aspergillus heteromorphus CBS 117.55]PWY67884.1 arylamine N-acetyltransferase 2 [Aspergillus heteromorphus CBS 117.55]
MTNSDPEITVEASAYTTDEVIAWLHHIRLPNSYTQYIQTPTSFPKTYDSLRTLMRCQISRFPFENLSLHYSPAHNVSVSPGILYEKMMGPNRDGGTGKGGYCMELTIFFHHMLCGLGFQTYMTGVRNRPRVDGVPGGEYTGLTHINNIVHLPTGQKFSMDVGFGGDGPTSPLSLDDPGQVIKNLGLQEVRLILDHLPKQRLRGPKYRIYQYRNGPDKEWNSFYSFTETDCFANHQGLHRSTVMVVRFLQEGEEVRFSDCPGVVRDGEVRIVGKVILVENVVKVNLGGKTQVVHSFDSEVERVRVLREYFGIELTDEEQFG